MKKIISIILVLLIVATSLMGCSNTGLSEFGNNSTNNGGSTDENNGGNGTTPPTNGNGTVNEGEKFEGIPEPGKVDFSKTDADMFTPRDSETTYDQSKAIQIKLDGTSGPVASSSTVKINGGKITITADKTHIISGTLSDGQIIIDAPSTAKLQIILNGVQLTSSTSAPIYVKEANKVFITLVGENTLSNGGTFTAIDESNIDGVIYSKQDLTLNGNGSLTLTSPAGHGIVCNDDLVITGGTYNISCASHGINANDSVRISGADITSDSGKDGIHIKNNTDSTLGFFYMASGTLNITSQGDGISAGATLQINDGNVSILAGGGYTNGDDHSSDGWGGFPGHPGGGRPPRAAETTDAAVTDDASTSMKGIKASSGILIEKGTFTIDSADDSIHSNSSTTINGGTFNISSGDDAMHAVNTIVITAGNIDIKNSYEGLEAMYIYIQGGNISIISTDDGINAAGGQDDSGLGGRDDMFGQPGGFGGQSSNGSISISGGQINIQASGDGIDVNGDLEISGGTTIVTGPTTGDTSVLDFDKNGVITGGTFIGTGAKMMAQTFTQSEQGVLSLNVGTQSAGVQITVKDADGNTVISHSPALACQIVIISSPELVSGQTYTITVGSQTEEFVAK